QSYDHLHPTLHSFPTRRSSDLTHRVDQDEIEVVGRVAAPVALPRQLEDGVDRARRHLDLEGDELALGHTTLGSRVPLGAPRPLRSEEHTSELQSLAYLVCRLLL